MEDWKDQCLLWGMAVFMMLLVYIIVRMVWNIRKGKDELDGLFAIRFKRKKNRSGGDKPPGL